MNSSYRPEDVTLLLKDITGLVEPMSTKEREIQIQAGRSYCEMLPKEYVPSEKYLEAYEQALIHETDHTAAAVRACAERIYEEKGDKTVWVSLARAGVPIGILLKWYLRKQYGIDVPHYGISIIRGRCIDHNGASCSITPTVRRWMDWQGCNFDRTSEGACHLSGGSSRACCIIRPRRTHRFMRNT